LSTKLTQRLNGILPKIISPDFLSGAGIGNEIPFYIFDYPAEEELSVRKHIHFLHHALAQEAPNLKFRHVNCLDLLTDYLESRGYLERSLAMESRKGTVETIKAIKGMASAEKLADFFKSQVLKDNPDLVFLSGLGSAFPVVRTHELLNNLHRHMRSIPLILFYPGVYNQKTLLLFGNNRLSSEVNKIKPADKSAYYRAFRLIE
jgi:hypothetical protein